MNHTPEGDAQRLAWLAMSRCMLDAQIANRPLAQIDSPVRDIKAFERACFAAAGELIANSVPEDRPDLAWAVWACLTTELKPGERNAA